MLVKAIRFPAKSQIHAAVQQHGFVARAATLQGKRAATLEIEFLQGNRIAPRDFGYVVGTAIHDNVGLEQCSQITLFDLKRPVGASSHLQIVDAKGANGVTGPQDLKTDVADMVEILKVLGSSRSDLAAYCIFGANEEFVADVRLIISTIRSAGIPVIGSSPCLNSDDLYATHLSKGLITISSSESMRSRRLFLARPNRPDLSEIILQLFEEGSAYHREICGDFGTREFNGHLLPRLVALYSNRPAKAAQSIREAVDLGADHRPSKIGLFFKSHQLLQD